MLREFGVIGDQEGGAAKDRHPGVGHALSGVRPPIDPNIEPGGPGVVGVLHELFEDPQPARVIADELPQPHGQPFRLTEFSCGAGHVEAWLPSAAVRVMRAGEGSSHAVRVKGLTTR